MEGVLRIFDRHGERKSRAKARLKFLIKDIGLEDFKSLVDKEQNAIQHKTVEIDYNSYTPSKPVRAEVPSVFVDDEADFKKWKSTNLIQQKQDGYVAIGIKVLLGDFYTDKARLLANLVENYAAGEIRLTLRQNILIPFVKEELSPYFYMELKKLGFTELGYNKAVDITACPGTDTCNLGIASSTGIAEELERIIKAEYPQYLNKEDLVIKISGCMNACGQHNMANIGFQGMSIRTKDKRVAPALQVLLGGGNKGDGRGVFADKLVKIPSRRGPEALRRILNDYEQNGEPLKFEDYYAEKGDRYFYDLLTDLSSVDDLTDADFIDWGNDKKYVKAIGIGECAGVVIDLVATLFLESEEKIEEATEALSNKVYSSAIYHAYTSMVNSAKALLISEDVTTNTQAGIIKQFEEHFVDTKKIDLPTSFSDLVYQIRVHSPSEVFAKAYIKNAKDFLKVVRAFREQEMTVKL